MRRSETDVKGLVVGDQLSWDHERWKFLNWGLLMNSAELAANVLSQLESTDLAFNPPELDEKGKRNAARMMQEIVCQRLRAGGATLEKQRGSRYLWGDGIILIRNGSVGVFPWTQVQLCRFS